MVISPLIFQSKGNKGNLAARMDRAQTHRTPEDKGKGELVPFFNPGDFIGRTR